jgi:integrase
MTLRKAREASEAMQAEKTTVDGRTFREVAEEFLRMQAPRRRSRYVKERTAQLERDVFPEIGDLPLAGITTPQVLATLRKVEARGVGVLPHRLRDLIGQVFKFGIAAGECERDPARDVGAALRAQPPVRHHPCIEPDELPALLTAIRGYDGERGTVLGLLLTIHVFVRTQEVIGARWEEFTLEGDTPLWLVPELRMKKGKEHAVPLSPEVVAILAELKGLAGSSPYVFPSVRNPLRPMGRKTLLEALYKLGFKSKMTVHGMRALASTILNDHRERGLIPWSADVIELCLAHRLPGGNVRAAYNRNSLLEQRRELMKQWSKFLTEVSCVDRITK